MPSFHFYAAPDDRGDVVAFALNSLACRVFEKYSAPDAPLREFAASELPRLDTAVGIQDCHLVVWSPSFRAEPLRRRIQLTPGAIPGHSHRFVLEGWGLVHLQFVAIKGNALSPSRLTFNSEARARKWETTDAVHLGASAAWDWNAVADIGRRLRNHIARAGVAKVGACPILRGANERAREGVVLAAV